MSTPQRRFEIFACETWLDEKGNVLRFDHQVMISERIDGVQGKAPNAQLTFDEWLEDQRFWAHHLEHGDHYTEEDSDGF